MEITEQMKLNWQRIAENSVALFFGCLPIFITVCILIFLIVTEVRFADWNKVNYRISLVEQELKRLDQRIKKVRIENTLQHMIPPEHKKWRK